MSNECTPLIATVEECHNCSLEGKRNYSRQRLDFTVIDQARPYTWDEKLKSGSEKRRIGASFHKFWTPKTRQPRS